MGPITDPCGTSLPIGECEICLDNEGASCKKTANVLLTDQKCQEALVYTVAEYVWPIRDFRELTKDVV